MKEGKKQRKIKRKIARKIKVIEKEEKILKEGSIIARKKEKKEKLM